MRGGASFSKIGLVMGSSDVWALPLIALPGVRHSKSQAIGFSSASRTTPQLPVNGEKEAELQANKKAG